MLPWDHHVRGTPLCLVEDEKRAGGLRQLCKDYLNAQAPQRPTRTSGVPVLSRSSKWKQWQRPFSQLTRSKGEPATHASNDAYCQNVVEWLLRQVLFYFIFFCFWRDRCLNSTLHLPGWHLCHRAISRAPKQVFSMCIFPTSKYILNFILAYEHITHLELHYSLFNNSSHHYKSPLMGI